MNPINSNTNINPEYTYTEEERLQIKNFTCWFQDQKQMNQSIYLERIDENSTYIDTLMQTRRPWDKKEKTVVPYTGILFKGEEVEIIRDAQGEIIQAKTKKIALLSLEEIQEALMQYLASLSSYESKLLSNIPDVESDSNSFPPSLNSSCENWTTSSAQGPIPEIYRQALESQDVSRERGNSFDSTGSWQNISHQDAFES